MKRPKTGKAKKMRAWMSVQVKPFSPKNVCDGLNLPLGTERDRLRNAMPDFLTRGEIIQVSYGKYRYNKDYKRIVLGAKKKKIYKAIYILKSGFSANKVKKCIDTKDQETSINFIQKVLKQLQKDGHIRLYAKGKAPGSQSLTNLYELIDRDKFRKELMQK